MRVLAVQIYDIVIASEGPEKLNLQDRIVAAFHRKGLAANAICSTRFGIPTLVVNQYPAVS